MCKTKLAATLSLAALLLGPVTASAQEEGIRLNIDEISCREMLLMGGEERDFTLIFLHGFMSGKNALIEFDGPALTEATDVIMGTCIDNPDDSLLSVFEGVRGD